VNRFIDMTAEMKNHFKGRKAAATITGRTAAFFHTKRGSGSPLLLIHELNPIASSYEWCRLVKNA